MGRTVMFWLPDDVRVQETRAGDSEELKRLIEQTERDIRYYQQGKQANASQFMPLLGIFNIADWILFSVRKYDA